MTEIKKSIATKQHYQFYQKELHDRHRKHRSREYRNRLIQHNTKYKVFRST